MTCPHDDCFYVMDPSGGESCSKCGKKWVPCYATQPENLIDVQRTEESIEMGRGFNRRKRKASPAPEVRVIKGMAQGSSNASNVEQAVGEAEVDALEATRVMFVHLCEQYSQMGEQLKVMASGMNILFEERRERLMREFRQAGDNGGS